MTGIFAIRSDVAQTIAGKLTATLSPAEKNSIEAKPTNNLEAYDLYLRGTALVFNALNLDNILASKGLLLEAVGRLDPNFVLAYCSSAHANGEIYF